MVTKIKVVVFWVVTWCSDMEDKNVSEDHAASNFWVPISQDRILTLPCTPCSKAPSSLASYWPAWTPLSLVLPL